MSKEAKLALAKEIISHPEVQQKVALKRLSKKGSVIWAKVYAEVFIDSEVEDEMGLVRSIFIAKTVKAVCSSMPQANIANVMLKKCIELESFYNEQLNNMLDIVDGKEESPKKAAAPKAKKKAAPKKAAKPKKEAAKPAVAKDAEALRLAPVAGLKIHGSARAAYIELGLKTVGSILDFGKSQPLTEVDGVGDDWAADTIEAIRAIAPPEVIAENDLLKG